MDTNKTQRPTLQTVQSTSDGADSEVSQDTELQLYSPFLRRPNEKLIIPKADIVSVIFRVVSDWRVK
jgi:hypothetical protein